MLIGQLHLPRSAARAARHVHAQEVASIGLAHQIIGDGAHRGNIDALPFRFDGNQLRNRLAPPRNAYGVASLRALDQLAVKAARVVGLDIAAVDLLEAAGGPMVFDVNSSPGLKGLEKATGKDLALPIVGRAEELVRG